MCIPRQCGPSWPPKWNRYWQSCQSHELCRSAGAASVHDPAARSFGIAKLLSHCVRRAASRELKLKACGALFLFEIEIDLLRWAADGNRSFERRVGLIGIDGRNLWSRR